MKSSLVEKTDIIPAVPVQAVELQGEINVVNGKNNYYVKLCGGEEDSPG